MTVDVAIIGAGIVGTACAAALAREGRSVLVLDENEPGSGATFGPAGLVTPGRNAPLVLPGMWRNLPRWLRDANGPLRLRATHAPQAVPWLMRLAAQGRPARLAANSAALRALQGEALTHYAALLGPQMMASLVKQTGQLHVYRADGPTGKGATARFGADLWRRRRAEGLEVEELTGAALRAFEPALSPQFKLGIHLPTQAHVTSPQRLARTLMELAAAAGGTFRRARVAGLDPRGGCVTLDVGGQHVRAGHVVIAAGIAGGTFARQLGDRLPLESERGYHAHVIDPQVTPRRPLIFAERGFAATPMEDGLRIAGSVEFAGLKAPPDLSRADKLLQGAEELLPGLQAREVSRWMGHRPSLPDSLPVIDHATRARRVIYAFGHGHTGLNGAPMTALCVAALVAGREPPIALAPFATHRFALRRRRAASPAPAHAAPEAS